MQKELNEDRDKGGKIMIYYCQITQNRLRETIESVNAVLPFVDKAIIVDGGSVDDTIVYMRNWEKEEPKIKFIVSAWRDNFPAQRNVYLREVPTDNWVVVSDPDEVFARSTCDKFRALAEEAEKRNLQEYDGVAFRAHDVFKRGEKIVHTSVSDFHKPLMFMKYSDTIYDINSNPHENLIRTSGAKYRFKRASELEYFHIKQENVIWVRGARNFFIGGGGMNLGRSNPSWVSFRELVYRKTRIKKWDDFYQYLVAGNIDNEIKDWMIRHKDEDGYDGSSEVREIYKTYFRILHPEEEPEGLRSVEIR